MEETSKKVGVSRRGIEIVTQGEVEERNRERIPQNTRKSTAWHTRVWDGWALERNSLPLEQRKADDFTVVPEYDTLYTLWDFELSFWLFKFVHEIKKDGSEYPPNTFLSDLRWIAKSFKREWFARVGHFPKSEI